MKMYPDSPRPAFAVVGNPPAGCWLGQGEGARQCAGRLTGCSGRLQSLEVDQDVKSGETHSRHIWFIRSGLLRVQRYGVEGRRQVLSLAFPGEVVGYENQLREGMSIETATPSRLCRIAKSEFDAMLRGDHDLRRDFLLQQQRQLDRLLWLTWAIGALRAEERFSGFLALASRFMPFQPQADGTGVLTMLLSRADIADLLATTVESISRMTHRLAETGVIEIRDPAHFRILKMKELVRIGQLGTTCVGFPTSPRTPRTRLDALFGMIVEQPDCMCA